MLTHAHTHTHPHPQEILDSSAAAGSPLLDLGAYLIMPVQRLPRYELLLREVHILVCAHWAYMLTHTHTHTHIELICSHTHTHTFGYTYTHASSRLCSYFTSLSLSLSSQLRKFTPTFHPDSDPIDEALNKMKVTENERERESE